MLYIPRRLSPLPRILLGLGVIFTVATFLQGLRVTQNQQRQELRVQAIHLTLHRAAPLLQAIQRYQRDQGRLPTHLHALVPKYLAQLPEPGPLSETLGWGYQSLTRERWLLDLSVNPALAIGEGDRFLYYSDGNYYQDDEYMITEHFGSWLYSSVR